MIDKKYLFATIFILLVFGFSFFILKKNGGGDSGGGDSGGGDSGGGELNCGDKRKENNGVCICDDNLFYDGENCVSSCPSGKHNCKGECIENTKICGECNVDETEYVDENAQSIGEIDKSDRDALFEDAARIIVQHQQGSASLLQRKLKLGYNRAGRIVDQLEAAGIIGPFEGSKARQVLITDEMSLEQLLNNE